MLAKVGGLCLGIASGVLLVFKFVGRTLRAIRVSDALHRHFGDDPAKTVHALICGGRQHLSEFDIRQRIIERSLHLGIYQCAPDGKCCFANDVLCDILGIDSRDATGYGWLNAVVDRKSAFEKWQFAVANQIPYRDEYVIENRREHTRTRARTEAFPATAGDAGNAVIVCYVGYVVLLEQPTPIPPEDL